MLAEYIDGCDPIEIVFTDIYNHDDEQEKVFVIREKGDMVALGFGEIDQRLGQRGNRRCLEQGAQTVGAGGTVEQAEQLEQGQRALAALVLVRVFVAGLKPLHIGVHHMKGVAALFFGIRLGQFDEVAPPDVSGMGVDEIAAEQVEGQCMALDVGDQSLVFRLSAMYPQMPQQRHPGGGG